jgi:hypothetical protein
LKVERNEINTKNGIELSLTGSDDDTVKLEDVHCEQCLIQTKAQERCCLLENKKEKAEKGRYLHFDFIWPFFTYAERKFTYFHRVNSRRHKRYSGSTIKKSQV